jgi:hypothetical protein
VSISTGEFAALFESYSDLRFTPPSPGFQGRLEATVSVRERAGVGAQVNGARLTLRRGVADVERSEMTAAQLAAGAGTNRVEPRGTTTFHLAFDFHEVTADLGQIVLVAVDDHGHAFTSMGTTFPIR